MLQKFLEIKCIADIMNMKYVTDIINMKYVTNMKMKYMTGIKNI